MTAVAGDSEHRPHILGLAMTAADVDAAEAFSGERIRYRRAWRLPRALRPYRLRADDIVITPVDVGRDLEYGRD